MTVARTGSGGGGDKYLHPEGLYHFVCIDEIDLGMQETAFGPKHKVLLRFYCGEQNADGEILYVNARFTLSLHEKSNLRKFLEDWRGQPFPNDPDFEFDLENLVGAGGLFELFHKPKRDGDGAWCNIRQVFSHHDRRFHKDRVPAFPEGYVRDKDKPDSYDEPTYEPPPPPPPVGHGAPSDPTPPPPPPPAPEYDPGADLDGLPF